ncbi:FecR family protein [Peristeroidobacter soli]|uniref:FecR family protein n=1 Tax=Peristeroidobacter soli TaxID=2497877 RepID=UPI00158A3D4A|nr:FecR domain-containing protein [Peristeroidobacter soli]
MAGEASEWIARIDRGLSAVEQQSLEEWLAADRAHVVALMKLARVYDKLDSMGRLADLFPRPEARPRRWLLPAAAAASLLILIGAVSVLAWRATEAPHSAMTAALEIAAGEQTFSTPVGEHSTIRLPDGSSLTLNTDTRVRARFTARTRELFLDRGEMHLQVAHERDRPLNVYIGDRFVQAVGTEFNLRIANDQRVELLVTEGKVLVGLRGELPSTTERMPGVVPAGKSVKLASAGDLLVVNDASPGDARHLAPEEIVVRLSWRAGNLVFRGESLAEALGEIERYTSVEFIISDERLKQIRVAGLFKTGDVEGLLKTLQENFNVSYRRVGDDKIILASAPQTVL